MLLDMRNFFLLLSIFDNRRFDIRRYHFQEQKVTNYLVTD